MDQYQNFIHQSKYARWLDEFGRRENWDETIYRFLSFMLQQSKECGYEWTEEERAELYQGIRNMEVMPSMRAMMTAGTALDRNHIAGYNCSYLPVDHPRAFDEALIILMNGTGVGFSVERDMINKLPTVPDTIIKYDEPVVIKDSKEGWQDGLRKLISGLYAGVELPFDTSNVRGAGERLKTFGGRASGPVPLLQLREFVAGVFRNAVGRKLTDIECHDIMCKIGEIVVVGGVRRSAMISLSNLSSNRMRDAKAGQWWENNPHRALANNSWVWTMDEKPDAQTFLDEWSALVKSGSGERGIFNRAASKNQSQRFGRSTDYEFGTNPCSEIILRPNQFCNLTEVVARSDDSYDSLRKKVELATILGTIQSTLTNFKGLRKIWKDNTEAERLLGVSITGIFDCLMLTNRNKGLDKTLEKLRDHAIETNKIWAGRLGINPSAAITCVKPSGTVSQLVDSASGIHPRHASHYIRTVRGDNKDPLTQFLVDAGVEWEPCVMKPQDTTVFSFAQKAPEGCTTRADLTAVDHLEMWLTYQRHWCMHKPSVTINVRDEEWMAVGAWVYEHFDEVSGISFLPYSEHTYAQAPYQECDQDRYDYVNDYTPEIDWEKLAEYEGGVDHTKSSQTMACSSDTGCEVVDI